MVNIKTVFIIFALGLNINKLKALTGVQAESKEVDRLGSARYFFTWQLNHDVKSAVYQWSLAVGVTWTSCCVTFDVSRVTELSCSLGVNDVYEMNLGVWASHIFNMDVLQARSQAQTKSVYFNKSSRTWKYSYNIIITTENTAKVGWERKNQEERTREVFKWTWVRACLRGQISQPQTRGSQARNSKSCLSKISPKRLP